MKFLFLYILFSSIHFVECHYYAYKEYETIINYNLVKPKLKSSSDVKIHIQGEYVDTIHAKYLNHAERENYHINNTLVIGAALGYEYNNYKYFIMSLRKYYKGDVLLFIDEKSSEESFNFLRRYSIDHVNLTKTYPYYSVNNKEYPINSSYIHSHICDRNYYNKFATIRMFLINMWLNIYGYKYEYFLSCDVRDIYFQSNPFAWNIGKGVYLAEQTCNFKMYNSYYDVLWIIGYKYGYKYLNNTLINSGVIYGSRNEITHFYNKMTEFMLTRYFKTSDQGIFNLMLYLNDLTYIPLYISQNGYGFVWNLHLELFFNIKTYGFPVNNYIYNLDGSIPPLIHSYNSNTLDVVKYHCKYI